MTPFDILYTPLDIPEPPAVDLNLLVDWVRKYQDEQEILNRKDSSKVLKEKYPWDIIYCKVEYHWYQDFDKLFPTLAEYCDTAFGVPRERISNIVILYTKDNFVGEGFWHTDTDETGLRFYLDNQEKGEFLHMRPTVLPYTNRASAVDAIQQDVETALQKKHFSAKLLKPNQGFFINNVRSIHSAYTSTPGLVRISFSVTVDTDMIDMPKSLSNLIVQSAEKYKEHALFWCSH